MQHHLPRIVAAGLLTACLAAPAFGQIANYSQNFESLDRNSLSALGDDGWKLFANVFDPTGTSFVYGYGVFPAPNDISNPNISVISDSTSAPVGTQGLRIFNDYNNGDHGNGTNRRIEVNVFQERTITAADIGSSYTFSFIAAPVLTNLGVNELAGTDTTALAFIKTLDPAAGFATTNFITLDTAALVAGNTALSMQIDLTDPLLVGQILQFGFNNTADNFAPSAVNYDDVSFTLVPEPATASLFAAAGLVMLARRRRCA